jgi:gas vesicle protein
MKGTTGKMLMGIIIGAAAGAVAGLLLAPDKGSVTRKKIADKAKETGDNLKETVTGKYEDVKEFVSDKYDKIKNKTKNRDGSPEYQEEASGSKMNN